MAKLAGRLARIALVAPALARLKRKATRAAIGIGLVLVFGALGLTYLLIALRYQLEREIGPLWTPIAIGGVLALAALVAYLALLRPRRQGRAAAQAEAVGLPPGLTEPMRNLEARVSGNPLPSIAIALAAGFAAAYALRLFRKNRAPAESPPPSSPWPRESRSEWPPWMREAVQREAERRRANGKGA